jgi:hypothetical protein
MTCVSVGPDSIGSVSGLVRVCKTRRRNAIHLPPARHPPLNQAFRGCASHGNTIAARQLSFGQVSSQQIRIERCTRCDAANSLLT